MLTSLAAPPFVSTGPAPAAPMPAHAPAPHAPAGAPAPHPFAKMLRQNQTPAPSPQRPASPKADADPSAADAPNDAARIDKADVSSTKSRGRPDQKAATVGQHDADKREADPALDDTKTANADDAAVAATPDASMLQWLAQRPANADARAAGAAVDGGEERLDATRPAIGPDPNRLRGQARLAEQAEASDGADLQRKTDAAMPAAKTFAGAVAHQAPAEVQVAAAVLEHVETVKTNDGPAHRIDAVGATPAFSAASFTPAGSTAPATAAPLNVTLATPLGAPDFAQALGAQVSMLASDGVQRAELHLHPAEMGPVSIQITLDGAQARVDFGADMAATRHVIESGLPELASALRDAGLTLTGGGVSPHARGRGEAGQQAASDGQKPGRGGPEVEPVAAPRQRHVAIGGVDLYA